MAEVTVLMPVLNAMPHLPEALKSILSQSLTDIICTVVDGGSTDGSWEYLSTVSDPRLVLAQSTPGIGRQLALAVDMCKTEFMARMDADDIAAPDRLEKQLAFMKTHKSVGLVGTQYAHFAADPDHRICLPMPTQHKEIYQYLLDGRLSLIHPTIMCRTELLRRAGGYITWGMGGDEDWDLFIRMGEVSELANLDEVLHLWRLHTGSMTNKNTSLALNRIRYACDKARRRADGRPELAYDIFLKSRSGALQRLLDQQDCYSLQQYRRGLYELLSRRRITGSIRLAWSAICSPGRTARWFGRYFAGHAQSIKRGYA